MRFSAGATPEEPPRRDGIPLRRYQYVDDLPVLVDGAKDIAPHAGDLDIRLVDIPPITGVVAAKPGDVRRAGV
jgi:hypothetical protein